MKNTESSKKNAGKTEKSVKKTENSDRKEEKREMILNAASRLFVEKGYNNTRIIDIADSCGVAKGTVYEYFDSKDQLVIEWAHKAGVQSAMTMKKIRDDNTSAVEKLEKYVDAKLNAISNTKSLMNVMIEKGQLQNPDNSRLINLLLSFINNEMGTLLDIIEKGVCDGEFRDDIDVKSAASLIMSSILTFSMFIFVPGRLGKSDYEALMGLEEVSGKAILDTILSGIRK